MCACSLPKNQFSKFSFVSLLFIGILSLHVNEAIKIFSVNLPVIFVTCHETELPRIWMFIRY